MSKAYLSLSRVDMTFTGPKGANPVLRGIDLDVQRGEYISLIGHSGCGKSTVLNIVAGLLAATSGGVIVDGREVNAPGPDRAVVFQNHSLLPWLTVYQNVELAVDKIFRDKRSAAERRDWILHNLAMVNMSHALDRLPSEISGGMKQR
ncbi:MAG TPA: ATP-binding cassette domain-containing protein, partial [Ramlibacter sp.]